MTLIVWSLLRTECVREDCKITELRKKTLGERNDLIRSEASTSLDFSGRRLVWEHGSRSSNCRRQVQGQHDNTSCWGCISRAASFSEPGHVSCRSARFEYHPRTKASQFKLDFQ